MTEFIVVVLSGAVDVKDIHGCSDMKGVRDIIKFYEFKYADQDVTFHVYRLLEV